MDRLTDSIRRVTDRRLIERDAMAALIRQWEQFEQDGDRVAMSACVDYAKGVLRGPERSSSGEQTPPRTTTS